MLLGEAIHIDAAKRRVILSDGALDYDTLIVATGATHQYFGHDEWEQFAPGLKNLDDATAMRGRILLAFEAAERETRSREARCVDDVRDRRRRSHWRGAGWRAGRDRDTTRCATISARSIPRETRIILVEGTDRALPAYPPKLSEAARKMLERLGVTVRTGAMVTDVRADGRDNTRGRSRRDYSDANGAVGCRSAGFAARRDSLRRKQERSWIARDA